MLQHHTQMTVHLPLASATDKGTISTAKKTQRHTSASCIDGSSSAEDCHRTRKRCLVQQKHKQCHLMLQHHVPMTVHLPGNYHGTLPTSIYSNTHLCARRQLQVRGALPATNNTYITNKHCVDDSSSAPSLCNMPREHCLSTSTHVCVDDSTPAR